MPQSFDPSIIREIAAMGHEIGYHYETMDTADGDPVLALKHFEDGLKPLRDITEIRTICMHSSPLSRYDNRDLWKSYSYRDYGIIGEPYFDLDFSRVLYLTDTGRRWDGDKVSVRDRAPQSVLASAGGLRQVPDGQSRHLGDANAGKPGQALDGQSRHPGDVNTEESGQASEGWIRRPGNVNNKGSGQGSEQQVSRPGKAKADVSGEASEEQDRRPDKANADGFGEASEELGRRSDKADTVGSRQKSIERAMNPHDVAMDDNIEGQRLLSELYRLRSTADLIEACRNDQLPPQMMINFHPQRWTDDSIPWIREWLMQNVKNVAKRELIWGRG